MRAPENDKRHGLFAPGLTPVAKSSCTALAVTIGLIALLLIIPIHFKTFSSYDTSTLSYLRGTVTEIVSEESMGRSTYTGLMNGSQELRVKVSDGRTLDVQNEISDTHHVYVHKGSRVIVCADEPENAEPYYTLFNYDRTPVILLFLALFAFVMIVIGGIKGLFSLAALTFSVVLIFRVTVPAIYGGVPAIPAALLTALVITAVSVTLFTGYTWKSFTSGAVTLCGELCAVGLFALFSNTLQINGFLDENADSLIVVTQNTGMDLTHLLYAAAIISSLGAVMDVAVSLIAAIWEVYEHNHTLTQRELFVSGMTIGRDMMGTMSNTLILAFVGTALSMILVLYSYGVQPVQLFNSDYMSIELSHGLCGTLAVIITVPVASALSSFVLPRIKRR